MKKILVLTASYGTGHKTAAKYVAQALSSDKVVVKIVDLLQPNKKISVGNSLRKIYNTCMEEPHLWDIVFTISNNKVIFLLEKYLIPFSFPFGWKVLVEELPDLCITTHPYWNFIINKYNSLYKKRLRYICIITDSIAIHRSWVGDGADDYIVADVDTQLKLTNFGISIENIHPLGFPVNPQLYAPFDKAKFLTELGLQHNRTTILIVLGLGDVDRFLQIINYLGQKKTILFQVIVITGTYKKMYDLLSLQKFNAPVKVIGWTDKMADFIRSSDLVISKGGGAIVMETLSAGKPIFVPVYVPGQEKGNVAIIKKYQLGYTETKISKICQILDTIITEPTKLQQLHINVEKYRKLDASTRIAKFIYSRYNI